jgi:hypothetical protein
MSAECPRHIKPVLAASVAALLALGLLVAGMTEGIACLAPALVMFCVLWLRCYPGERVLLVLSQARRAPRRAPRAAVRSCQLTRMPRGGRLLACALCGRAPPAIQPL